MTVVERAMRLGIVFDSQSSGTTLVRYLATSQEFTADGGRAHRITGSAVLVNVQQRQTLMGPEAIAYWLGIQNEEANQLCLDIYPHEIISKLDIFLSILETTNK